MAGKTPLTPRQISNIIAAYERGDTLETIGRRHGRSARGISGLLRREGVPTRTGHAEHGTTARALKHYRDGEKPCSDCAAAWRALQPAPRAEMSEEEREAVREAHRKWHRKRAARKRRKRGKRAWVKRRDRARREAAIQASVPDALDRLGRSLGLKE